MLLEEARSGRGARRLNRGRLTKRALALIVLLGAGAFALGIVVGTGPSRERKKTVQQFVRAWARGDYTSMYALLDGDAQKTTSFRAFRAAYQRAAATATATRFTVGKVGGEKDDTRTVPVVAHTRVFGPVRGTVHIRADGKHVVWRPENVFPGLQSGERLTARLRLPPRAALLARDGTVLARGPQRESSVPDVSGQIVGSLGRVKPEDRIAFERAGIPARDQVGISGLERIFEVELAGRPGGALHAGTRVLATARPRPGKAVRTTIDVAVERAATTALAGRYGGIAALKPNGEVLALAGVAFSALQPPGSTMKVVTTTGALEAGIAKPTSTFPLSSQAILDGVPLQNAGGEVCGGTLVNSFAVSCNSVFAPLGAKLGGRKLADIAQRFGFNHPIGIRGAAEPTFPDPKTLPDTLAVGSAAIGQDKVQSTALGMALVAATIADHGRRPRPTLVVGARPRYVRVTAARVTDEVRGMMESVVRYGTGTAAQIPGVVVAGKTGTAELRNTQGPGAVESDPANTTAWFVAFAPSSAPRIVVGAMFPGQGAGGQTAAPAAREVLVAGLQK